MTELEQKKIDETAEALVTSWRRKPGNTYVKVAPVEAFDDFVKPENQAIKYDQDKIRFDLVPFKPLQELARLYTFGAKKYDDHNWRKGFTYSRCAGALMRHYGAWLDGEDYDLESGMHHMSAVAFYAFALMEFHFTGKGTDDRYKP